MNAQDVESIAQVIEAALAGQRKTLQALIEQRRAECIDAQQASELAREQVTVAEDRLREFLERRSSDAVLAMQHAAAAELTRSQDLLLRKLQAADALAAEVRDLREQLQRAQPRSAYDIATSAGFAGSEADWLASLKGQPGDAPDAAAIVDALMRTHGDALAGKPGQAGEAGVRGPAGERGERGDPGSQGERGQDGRDGAGIDAPAWSPGIHREGVIVQAYMGQHYRALRDTSAEPYASADWQRVGTMGLHLAQPFAEGIEYALGDLVVRDYSTFVVDARGQLHLFAARGPVGEKGREGAKGKDGTDGRDGTNGKDGRDGYGIEDLQLAGGTLALLARNASGQMQDFTVDLVPLLETLGEAIEERLLRKLQGQGDAT